MKGVPGKVTLYDVRGIKGPYDAHLPDRDETPVPLERPINVQIYQLNQKILAEAQVTGRITHISLTSAVMVLKSAIGQWEDIRLLILNDDMELVPGKSMRRWFPRTRRGTAARPLFVSPLFHPRHTRCFDV